MKDFVKTWNLFWITFTWGFWKVTHCQGIWNTIVTQHKIKTCFNLFLEILRGNGSANNELSYELVPYSHSSIEQRIKVYNSTLLLMPKINRSPYCHSYWKTDSVLQGLMNKITRVKMGKMKSFVFSAIKIYVIFCSCSCCHCYISKYQAKRETTRMKSANALLFWLGH